MSWEVHIEWQGQPHLVGRLHAAERSPSVAFEYLRPRLIKPDAISGPPNGYRR